MKYSGIEKRRFKRGEGHFKVFFYTPDSNIVSCHSVNISKGGLKAIFDQRFSISTILKMEIYLQNEPTFCQGKVVWVRRVKSFTPPYIFRYEAGIEFIKE